MADEREDLENFLKDVDEIGFIIKNLSSHNEEIQTKAMKASDELLHKKQSDSNITTTMNKTEICRNTHEQKNNQECQEQFLESIELDANERAARRRKNERDAESLKEKGNTAFKAGRHEEAIEYYTEALNLVKYFSKLYTNRAQAYIILKKYDAAIDDCKWAIRVDEKCIKAYVHCGRALQRKSLFSEAISYFKMAEEIDPKHKAVIRGYISEVEHDQEKADIELTVAEELNHGDVRVKSLVEGIGLLLAENKELKEYIASAENLKQILKNNKTAKTLFRVRHGFKCFGEHSYFNRICETGNDINSPELIDFVNKMLDLARISVEDDEYNLEELLKLRTMNTIYKLLHNCQIEKVVLPCTFLLHQISESSQGREHILQYAFDERNFVENLMHLTKEVNPISKVVMGCLNNLSLEKRFALKWSRQLQFFLISVIEKFVTRPVDRSAETLLRVVSSSLSTIANLARVKDINSRLQQNQQIWELSLKVFSHCVDYRSDDNIKEIIHAQLGLLLNILSENSEYAKKYSVSIMSLLLKFLELPGSENILQRITGVLRLLMTYSPETISLVCSEESYKLILELLMNSADDLTVSYCVKCLALCTLNNDSSRTYVVEHGLMTIYQLLKSKNEVTIGNSALILGHCFEQKKTFERFVGTPIVKDLLTIASNKTFPKDVNHNAAIALAKLVKGDLRYLEQLRELHGLEILHTVIKSTGR